MSIETYDCCQQGEQLTKVRQLGVSLMTTGEKKLGCREMFRVFFIYLKALSQSVNYFYFYLRQGPGLPPVTILQSQNPYWWNHKDVQLHLLPLDSWNVQWFWLTGRYS